MNLFLCPGFNHRAGKASNAASWKRNYVRHGGGGDRMDVKPGRFHVLEIGCGWGGFAEYAAAKRGLRVTGLTISQAQHDYAVARMARLGLSDKVEIRMQDYRDTRGEFDGIASIEMFEAVGERYWPTYFNAVRDRLRPGAQAVIQIIMVPDARFKNYSSNVDFIQKHIFPGGMLARRPRCGVWLKTPASAMSTPMISGKAIRIRCGDGMTRSMPAGTRFRKWAMMRVSSVCGIST